MGYETRGSKDRNWDLRSSDEANVAPYHRELNCCHGSAADSHIYPSSSNYQDLQMQELRYDGATGSSAISVASESFTKEIRYGCPISKISLHFAMKRNDRLTTCFEGSARFNLV
jgi:hypothetical protein